MSVNTFLVLLLLQVCLYSAVGGEGAGGDGPTPYCIIGAGPGGLQLGYFLERADRDYVIFEKNSTAGSFYLHYPRHRKLISINKRNTGSTNKEFSFRHDWNSLISDDESLQMKHYSREYFPPADTYVRYLQDYASKLKLNIEYNTEIVNVSRSSEGNKPFQLTDQHGVMHQCSIVIVSTGIWVPNIPTLKGMEHALGYESMSIDPEDYENKVVLIMGRGNAGFETADAIVANTAYIHMVGRSRVKLAYQTHYVGDLRAVNAEQIDTYQLKSLDGQFEGDMTSSNVRLVRDDDGKLHLLGPQDSSDNPGDALFRHPYDVVIRCLGFKFDFSIFNSSSVPLLASSAGKDKYPRIHNNYQAVGIPNLFVAGAASHSLDFKRSAGGFIHGYRYTVKALFNHMQWLYHSIPWPSITLPSSQLLEHLIRRINEASGPYQMFGVLCDIALIRNDSSVVYLEEVPIKTVPIFKAVTGHDIDSFILWNFEYGENYSGPSSDVLREDRVGGDVVGADLSNFLHPVLYYYKKPPPIGKTWVLGKSPKPDLYHHIVEDFLTDWTSRSEHILPVRRFLEAALDKDLRSFFAESCFEMMLGYGGSVPQYCREQYLQGAGISSSDGFVDFGAAETFEDAVYEVNLS